MIAKAIQRIEEMAAPVYRELEDGRIYSSKQVYPILEPLAPTVEMNTLTGLVDYLTANIDGLDLGHAIIQVNGYNLVSVISDTFSAFRLRDTFAQAKHMQLQIQFERRMSVEAFIIQLQAMFVQTQERDNLLKFIGTLNAGFSKTIKDDGVTQNVTAKTGVTMVGEVAVPNPVILKPYRTFAEIEQPESAFVFRVHADHDEPTCALYEADGGAWKITAITSIADWLKENLPDISVIA